MIIISPVNKLASKEDFKIKGWKIVSIFLFAEYCMIYRVFATFTYYLYLIILVTLHYISTFFSTSNDEPDNDISVEEEIDLFPFSDFAMEKNPFLIGEEEIKVIDSCILDQTIFRIGRSKALSCIQYVEMKVHEKSSRSPLIASVLRSKKPFNQSSVLMEHPFSIALYRRGNLEDFLVSDYELKEGDHFGIGVIPLYSSKFLFFGTLNGKWMGYFIWKELDITENNNTIISLFLRFCDIDILSDSKVSSIHLGITNSQKFNLNSIDLQLCYYCKSFLPKYCLHNVSTCDHQVCQYCIIILAVADTNSLQCIDCRNANVEYLIEKLCFSARQKQLFEAYTNSNVSSPLDIYNPVNELKIDRYSLENTTSMDFESENPSLLLSSGISSSRDISPQRPWKDVKPLTKKEAKKVEKLIKQNVARRCPRCNYINYKDRETFHVTTGKFCDNCGYCFNFPHRSFSRTLWDMRSSPFFQELQGSRQSQKKNTTPQRTPRGK